MPKARLIAALLAFVCLFAVRADAQQPQTRRVRGQIEAVEANALTVRMREGPVVRIALADNLVVMGVSKLELAAIQTNSFVGAASLRQPDGSLRALEVLVFPESARGSGEGHYPWDLQPDSMMTNATVGAVTHRPDGRTLELSYKDGRQTVFVPEDTPVVTIAPGDRSLLARGAALFIGGATVGADGSLTAQRILVGRDGLVPPM